jgi:hypothetical protein
MAYYRGLVAATGAAFGLQVPDTEVWRFISTEEVVNISPQVQTLLDLQQLQEMFQTVTITPVNKPPNATDDSRVLSLAGHSAEVAVCKQLILSRDQLSGDECVESVFYWTTCKLFPAE